MKRKYLFLAMYRAMDCLYDEQESPSEELLQFVSDANPYMYVERTAVDPAVQEDFDSSMARQNIDAEVDEQTAYYAVKNFLAEQNPQFAELFTEISLAEWQNLCDLIAEEETEQNDNA